MGSPGWAYYGPSFGPAFVSAGAGTHEPMQIQAQPRRFAPPLRAPERASVVVILTTITKQGSI
ncbi:hypothetical protein PanWU01x14_083810 [Parasponia andersonii]|uniref:Uncharacterized protein n=1 Tax=Parasponia andersonii TaxID=3476 RepID=A0A2P5D9F1_PARAD|nr:hypothetical protein PanWU01x14_083810 [Parasponia andersonii]